jgi:hypothetical protein
MAVVEILKIGLSGFVFLLVMYNFRLLKGVMAKEKLDRRLSRKIDMFMWMNVGLVVIVGASAALSVGLQARLHGVKMCRNSLQRLDTQAKLPDVGAASLKNGIAGHVSVCQEVLESGEP